MKKEDKLAKVKSYLDRLSIDAGLPKYDLEEEGVFGVFPGFYQQPPGNEKIPVIAGFSNNHQRIQVYRGPVKEVISGRFLDVIAFAVQQSYFYSVGSTDPKDEINGFIEKVDLVPLEKDHDLDSLVEENKATVA